MENDFPAAGSQNFGGAEPGQNKLLIQKDKATLSDQMTAADVNRSPGKFVDVDCVQENSIIVEEQSCDYDQPDETGGAGKFKAQFKNVKHAKL